MTEPPPETPLISLQQVSMQFGGQRVLHAVDLEVRRGQTVAVIGESGCGKTVLLKLIIGLLRPTVGRVLFDGKVLADLPERELTKQRRRFGFLFQGAALFDSLTVYDNVAFGLHAQGGKPEAEVGEIVRQRLAGGRPAAGGDGEEAGRAVRRHEEARRPGAGAGPRPRGHALRRADHRPRSDHDRRDQRADPANAAAAAGDERRRDARDENGLQSGGSRRDALPAVAG